MRSGSKPCTEPDSQRGAASISIGINSSWTIFALIVFAMGCDQAGSLPTI
jgi:hypothetical protein